jgi:large subunit ribosomal protein L7/L12
LSCVLPRTTATTTNFFHTTTYNNNKPNDDDKVETLFQKILWLDMVEVHLLTELLQEKMGMSGAVVGATTTTSGAASSTRSTEEQDIKQEEKKTIFDLKLIAFDAKSKIKVIKEVRAITGLGLKEAKELVESAPTIIKKDMKQEEVEECHKKLQEVGATMEIV